MKKTRQMTPEIISAIKERIAQKKMFQHQIAAEFNLNSARVYEVKIGKYD